MKKQLVAAGFLLSLAFLLSSPAHAKGGWSVGLGYHNPPGATVGLNFLHLGQHWVFEAGIGYIGAHENFNSKDNRRKGEFTVAGDLNLKYLFGSSALRPYLLAGMTGRGGSSHSLGHAFGGAGLFLIGSSVHLYASYLFWNEEAIQAGFSLPF